MHAHLRWIDWCARNRFLVFVGTLLLVLTTLAGQKATVKGTVNGNTVTVNSVAPAKYYVGRRTVWPARRVSALLGHTGHTS